jgi:hypothetical protein
MSIMRVSHIRQGKTGISCSVRLLNSSGQSRWLGPKNFAVSSKFIGGHLASVARSFATSYRRSAFEKGVEITLSKPEKSRSRFERAKPANTNHAFQIPACAL